MCGCVEYEEPPALSWLYGGERELFGGMRVLAAQYWLYGRGLVSPLDKPAARLGEHWERWGNVVSAWYGIKG